MAATAAGWDFSQQREQREQLPLGSKTTDENDTRLQLRRENTVQAGRQCSGMNRRAEKRLHMTRGRRDNEVEGRSEPQSPPSYLDEPFDRYRDLRVKSVPARITA